MRSQTLKRLLYICLVPAGAIGLGLVVAIVIGAFFLEGEAAEGAGLYWMFSIPATALAGVVIAAATFRRFSSHESGIAGYALALASVFVAASMGLAATVALFEAYMALY